MDRRGGLLLFPECSTLATEKKTSFSDPWLSILKESSLINFQFCNSQFPINFQ